MLDRKSTTSEFLHQLFQQHQLDLVPEIELGSNDLLIDLANIGLGVAFVPDYCLTSTGTLFQVHIKMCIRDSLYPLTGREAVKLPSTSPANAAWNLEKLKSEWKICLSFMENGV